MPWPSLRASPPRRAPCRGGRASANRPDPGPVICACVDAGARQIIAAIEGQSLADGAAIGRALQAGTNRGSRRPRLQALLGARQPERIS